METRVRLEGIEPDNLLAFLALLGAMRALDRARPAWNLRSRWTGRPNRPEFSLAADVDMSSVEEALAEGVADLAKAASFGGVQDLKFPADACRTMLIGAVDSKDPERERVFAALMSDGAIKRDGNIATPPLCTMLGQGHQHFLSRLEAVGRGASTGKGAGKSRVDLSDANFLMRALLEPWKRSDATDAFRWDAQEDRRYALRDTNPSNDPLKTEHGANRLACIGLPLLTSFPDGRSPSAALLTVGFGQDDDRRRRITWPIWQKPLDLPTILALLSRAELHTSAPNISRLSSYGVTDAYRSYRVDNGYYANFTYATAMTSAPRVDLSTR